MKPPKPIPRISVKKLQSLGNKMPFSTVTKPKKAIKKVNPERLAKRKAGYRKMLAGKEYREARRLAMLRAGNMCEFGITEGRWQCFEGEDLHAHHLHYPKSRPLEARDLLIVCKRHHEFLESQKMHKQRMF